MWFPWKHKALGALDGGSRWLRAKVGWFILAVVGLWVGLRIAFPDAGTRTVVLAIIAILALIFVCLIMWYVVSESWEDRK
jgi:fructose-specific phosphotransferase system IIC component